MKIKYFLFLLVLLGIHFGFTSCEGCTDSNATNYDAQAREDDGSCIYNPVNRKFGFSTNHSTGGEIYVEISQDKDFSRPTYGSRNVGIWFNKDESDKFWPECGISKLAYFERNFTQDFYYDAHDRVGNSWHGTVTADEHECKLIELNRDPKFYSHILFYTSVKSQNVEQITARVDTTGGIYDKFKTVQIDINRNYYSSKPNCESVNGSNKLVTKAGTIEVDLYVNSKRKHFKLYVETPPAGCAAVDLANYLK